MKANINEDELQLLAFLHETVTGFGPSFAIAVRTVELGLGIDSEQLKRNASYLMEHGLAGVQGVGNLQITTGRRFFTATEIWLTGTGEDYMRELECQPGIAKKVTVAAVKEGWSVIRDIAVRVLSAHLTPHH